MQAYGDSSWPLSLSFILSSFLVAMIKNGPSDTNSKFQTSTYGNFVFSIRGSIRVPLTNSKTEFI